MDPLSLKDNNESLNFSKSELDSREVPIGLKNIITPEEWSTLTYEQKSILTNLKKLPSELLGVVPESVWDTLNVNQKLQFLLSHGVLPQTMSNILERTNSREEFESFKDQVEGNVEEVKETVETPNDFEQRQEFEKLRDEVHEMVQDEEPQQVQKPEEFASVPNVDNISRDGGLTFNSDPMPRFAGYQPDDSFMGNVDSHAKESPHKATTWAANIIQKFKASFA